MNRTNGSIRIPVTLETKSLERQIKMLYEQFTELDEKAEKALEADDTDTYNELTEKANELRAEYVRLLEMQQKQTDELKKQTDELQKQTGFQSDNVSKAADLKRQIREMLDAYNIIKKSDIISEEDEKEAEKLKQKIIELAKEIERITGKKVKIPGITDGDNNENSNGAKNLERNFKKLTKTAKKLALGIIGVRGAYMLFRKATSAYMEDNKQLTKDMEANWTALGVIMSGIIEALIDGFRKVVTGILYFMQCLTGTNYIAKANEAILRRQTRATKDLAKANDKLTTSYDELNILQDNSKNTNDDEGAYRLLDLNELGSGAIRTIERVAEVLKPVYNMIKGIVEWALEHPEVIIGLLGGSLLLSFLGKVLGVAGVGGAVGTGLAGILGVLLAIASIGVIVISIKTIYEEGSKLKSETQANTKAQDKLTQSTKDLNEKIKESVKNKDLNEEQTKVLTNVTRANTTASYESAKAMQKQNKEAGLLDKTVNLFTGHLDENKKQTNKLIEQMQSNIEVLKQEGDTYDWTAERTEAYRTALNQLVDVTDDSTKVLGFLNIKYEDTAKAAAFFGKSIGEPTTELEKQIVWNKQARDELSNLDSKVNTTSNFFDILKQKIAAVNGSKAKVEVELETSKSNKFSDKLISMGNNLGLGLLVNVGNVLKKIGLDTGGIVNLPGRGVPVGTYAVAGEARKEGVLPLTDAQTMEEMGRTIGRYVTIPITLINQMNGRTLSRVTKIVQADEDFAANR